MEVAFVIGQIRRPKATQPTWLTQQPIHAVKDRTPVCFVVHLSAQLEVMKRGKADEFYRRNGHFAGANPVAIHLILEDIKSDRLVLAFFYRMPQPQRQLALIHAFKKLWLFQN